MTDVVTYRIRELPVINTHELATDHPVEPNGTYRGTR